jgi:Lrp/AsnC family transcriptional regulator, leucine-responsive regulatory protein
MNIEFDSYDRKILTILQTDARMSMSELGRQVNLSQPAVTERVHKLEEAGVILGYHAKVSAQAMGFAISAVVRVGRCDFERMKQLMQSLPEVRNAYNVTGEDSWIAEICVRDVPHLDRVVSQFCHISESATSIILKRVVTDAPVIQLSATQTSEL